MFNLGFPEILVIGAAALILFGPKRLPELAKNLGKGIRDFKKALEGDNEEEGKSTRIEPGKDKQKEKQLDAVETDDTHAGKGPKA